MSRAMALNTSDRGLEACAVIFAQYMISESYLSECSIQYISRCFVRRDSARNGGREDETVNRSAQL